MQYDFAMGKPGKGAISAAGYNVLVLMDQRGAFLFSTPCALLIVDGKTHSMIRFQLDILIQLQYSISRIERRTRR